MARRFTWDPKKALRNLKDRGVSFEEAIGTFQDEGRVEQFDEGHSEDEARYSVIGFSIKGRLLFVSYTPRGSMGEIIRIIHAHEAEPDEEQTYEEHN